MVHGPRARNAVLLIQPPTDWQRLLRIKSKRQQFGAPLSLLYVAPYLLARGFDVEILDMRIAEPGELARVLAEKDPILAGITIMPGCALPPALRLSAEIKRLAPETRVVWGGSFPSLHHDACARWPAIDFVVCGDGEETLTELAGALRDGATPETLRNVAGLAFAHDGEVVATNPRQPVDLDRNPVGAWSLVERYMDSYLGAHGHLALNTARGCPFRCSFCYNTALYKGFKRYRAKSVEGVLEEVDYLSARYPIRCLRFWDDDFLGNERRAVALAEALNRRYPELTYHAAVRPDELRQGELVSHLAKTGLRSVFVGAESGSEEVLSGLEKGTHTNDTLEGARTCAANDVVGTYSFTCGYPGESRDALFATVRMAQNIKTIDPRNICFLEIISPVRGTALSRSLQFPAATPESLDQWCHVTDWKTAKGKDWIDDPGFYEAFQLAFLLAFTHQRSHKERALHLHTQLVSRWAQARLFDRKPRRLPEFGLANLLVKRLLWSS